MKVLHAVSFAVPGLVIGSCFNDIWMTFFILVFIYFAIQGRSVLATIFFAIGFSIKGIALLYLPGFLLISTFRHGIYKAFGLLLLFLFIQVVFAAPFCLVNLEGYIIRSFV